MFAETKKEVLVEYPINIVNDILCSLFPVKYYDLKEYDDVIHSFTVNDSFNPGFIMHITLKENSPNTTIINFLANYPYALIDLTEGGKQAIEMVLEELLKQLNKQPNTGSHEVQNSDIEVVNIDNFENTTKNKKHDLLILFGYILCFFSFVLPVVALINYNPDNIIMFTFFISGILALAMEISISIILQYYEDSSTILHGSIQLCFCGFSLIILGFLIHPSLIIAAIIIPLVVIQHFLKRKKYVD